MTTTLDRVRSKKAEIKLFRDHFLPLIQEHSSELNYDITGGIAMRGDLYKHELMIVGRAVNGGHSKIKPAKQAHSQKHLDKFISEILEDVTTEACPQRRIERGSYCINRSAFWRTSRAVTAGLRIAVADDKEWTSYLVLSNLYKLSPHDCGNPNGSLQKFQQSSCVIMLALELFIYKPKRVLFLTGDNWFLPFRSALGNQITPHRSKRMAYIHEAGNAILPSGHQFQYVVAPHPQGKQEGKIADDILRGFGSR